MSKVKVALLHCDRYDADTLQRTLLRGFELLGGPARFVTRGEKVLLKPNILAGCSPEQAVTTHPAVLEALIQILREAGARISYGDSSGITKSLAAAKDSGLAAVAGRHGVEIGDFGLEARLTTEVGESVDGKRSRRAPTSRDEDASGSGASASGPTASG